MKEPNPPFEVEIIDTEPVEVKNPYSGQKVKLQQLNTLEKTKYLFLVFALECKWLLLNLQETN